MKLKKPAKHDKIRLIFFSSFDSDIHQFDFNLQRLFLIFLFASFFIGCVFITSATISNSLYDDGSKAKLEKSNAYLNEQVVRLQDDIKNLDDKLNVLVENTEDLEVLVGLTSSTSDSDFIANSLNSQSLVDLSYLPIEHEYETDEMSKYLAVLESRMKNTLNVQGVIEDNFLKTQQELIHVPSIRPLHGGRIADKFGIRKDPFVERVKHHNGIDITARHGTKIYAAGSGVVAFTRARYKLNKGYGKVIIINHGFGYKTLYGHLSKILVKPGQKVDRWDAIGLSGSTGRATGPHLHYEVWKNGKAQNPENFILN